MLPAKLHKLY